MNYYNEYDKFAAAWLRELIKANQIAPGEVDERSIEDVVPSDLQGFTQCHFFAGIGVWSYALRQAGWPDDRAVWTGSCPCQPFSTAGKRKGTTDERHLWPALYHLISQCKPVTFFGEQVASKDGLAWFDTVLSDLEGAAYAVACADLCAAGFGAPHIRQRLYFVADAAIANKYGRPPSGEQPLRQSGSGDVRLAEPMHSERRPLLLDREDGRNGTDEGRSEAYSESRTRGQVRNLADPSQQQFDGSGNAGPRGRGESSDGIKLGNSNDEGSQGQQLGGHGADQRTAGAAGLVNGFWREADWIYCRDGKYRPVESGTFPLAHGATARVGRLRGYGNALVAPVSTAFIEAFLEVERGK